MAAARFRLHEDQTRPAFSRRCMRSCRRSHEQCTNRWEGRYFRKAQRLCGATPREDARSAPPLRVAVTAVVGRPRLHLRGGRGGGQAATTSSAPALKRPSARAPTRGKEKGVATVRRGMTRAAAVPDAATVSGCGFGGAGAGGDYRRTGAMETAEEACPPPVCTHVGTCPPRAVSGGGGDSSGVAGKSGGGEPDCATAGCANCAAARCAGSSLVRRAVSRDGDRGRAAACCRRCSSQPPRRAWLAQV